MRRARVVGLVVAAAAVGSTALAGIAEAKPFGERFHEESRSSRRTSANPG
jgi:hypothetical protein